MIYTNDLPVVLFVDLNSYVSTHVVNSYSLIIRDGPT
jgi:hypothetical protein